MPLHDHPMLLQSKLSAPAADVVLYSRAYPKQVFCKPHFTQVFKEKGNLSGFDEVVPVVPSSVPPSPAPSDAPAGENHVENSPRPTPPKPSMSTRRPEDFQSGFEPEYVPSTISKLQTDKCGKCMKKVFAIGKIEVDGRRVMFQSGMGGLCRAAVCFFQGISFLRSVLISLLRISCAMKLHKRRTADSSSRGWPPESDGFQWGAFKRPLGPGPETPCAGACCLTSLRRTLSRSPWHLNCFRCATCSCQLDLEMYKAGPKKEAVYCFKHGPK